MFEHDTLEMDALPEGRDYDNPVVMEKAQFDKLQEQASASEEAYSEFRQDLGDFSELREQLSEVREERDEYKEKAEELSEVEDRAEEVQQIKLAMAEELEKESAFFDAEELAELEFSKLRDKFETSDSELSPAPRGADPDDEVIEEEASEETELSEEDAERVEALRESINTFEGRNGWEEPLREAREELAELTEDGE